MLLDGTPEQSWRVSRGIQTYLAHRAVKFTMSNPQSKITRHAKKQENSTGTGKVTKCIKTPRMDTGVRISRHGTLQQTL